MSQSGSIGTGGGGGGARDLHTAKLIVNTLGTVGTGANYSTIASALAAAVSGNTIFVMPGVYTENLVLKAGVNISAYTCDGTTPNVTIVGLLSMTVAGTVSISGVKLQTNAGVFLGITGSAASIVFLQNCYLDCTNGSGITFSSSSASAGLSILNCIGNLRTTGINYFAHSSAGVMNILYCNFINDGASTTANTQSAGTLNIGYTGIASPIVTSGTASLTWDYMSIDVSSFNVTAATLGGSGVHNLRYCRYMSGTASAVSISNTTPFMESCVVNSSNTNAVTGSGTLMYSGMIFEGSSKTINTTTQTNSGTLQGSKNTAPAAGFLGERLTANATGVTLLNNTPTNVTSIALTAGVWDIDGYIYITNTGAGTAFVGQISTVTAAFTGVAGVQWDALQITGTAISVTLKPPRVRAVINATTTYFLVAQNSFTTGASGANGIITATRVG